MHLAERSLIFALFGQANLDCQSLHRTGSINPVDGRDEGPHKLRILGHRNRPAEKQDDHVDLRLQEFLRPVFSGVDPESACEFPR